MFENILQFIFYLLQIKKELNKMFENILQFIFYLLQIKKELNKMFDKYILSFTNKKRIE